MYIVPTAYIERKERKGSRGKGRCRYDSLSLSLVASKKASSFVGTLHVLMHVTVSI